MPSNFFGPGLVKFLRCFIRELQEVAWVRFRITGSGVSAHYELGEELPLCGDRFKVFCSAPQIHAAHFI